MTSTTSVGVSTATVLLVALACCGYLLLTTSSAVTHDVAVEDEVESLSASALSPRYAPRNLAVKKRRSQTRSRSLSKTVSPTMSPTPTPLPDLPHYELFGHGSQWTVMDQYVDLTTKGWTGLNYTDKNVWKTGFGPMGYGYGNNLRTIVASGTATKRRTTYYFRKVVAIGNVGGAGIGGAVRLSTSGGAIVYVNGMRAAIYNMPSITNIVYKTLSSRALTATVALKPIQFIIPPGMLREGLNTFAGSSCFRFTCTHMFVAHSSLLLVHCPASLHSPHQLNTYFHCYPCALPLRDCSQWRFTRQA
jgi:hypothetical protein